MTTTTDATTAQTVRVVSYGGGVQSTALLVLAAQRVIDFRVFLFANVGDDSEHPATLDYVRQIAMPYAAANDIALHELHRVRRDGTTETLYGRLTKPGSKRLPIPIRMSNGAPGKRSCTADFKIGVIGRWLKANGATRENPATVALGISVDEMHRANTRRCEAHEQIVYPLLDLGHRRSDCLRIIADAGMPVPGKSACYFCPFHRPSRWQEMRRREPHLFERSAQLEDLLNARRDELGKDHVYMTGRGVPLRDAIPEGQEVLFDDDASCDGGWCMT